MKKKVVIIVGSGLSYALTAGPQPVLGNGPLPTLATLGQALLDHIEQTLHDQPDAFPFSRTIIAEGVSILRANQVRDLQHQYDFEQLISLVVIRSALVSTALSESPSSLSGSNPAVMRFVVHALFHFFASRLSYNGTPFANRNFFYRVRDTERASRFKHHVHRLVDEFDVTFVSFNYDGIIEAFLDGELGQQSFVTHYSPEVSHAVPMVMPEHVYSHRDNRGLSRLNNLPVVLKPHGSIHFFQLHEDLHTLMGGPSIAALYPRLDIGFNPQTMQRDISEQGFWRFADPVPLIVPPLLNKDSFFGSAYFRVLLRSMVQALNKAEIVLSLGFSVPPSDLYVCAALETAEWSQKKLGLCFCKGPGDHTLNNWRRIAGSTIPFVLSDEGLPVGSVEDIDNFWVNTISHLSGQEA